MPDDRYTHGHHDAVLRSHRWRTAENSAAYLTPLLGPGMSLLDVGCGPGNLTLDLASVVAPGPVVGLDRSADVLAEASARLGGDSTVEFRTGDVYDLPFPDDSFDVVHAHQVLQHLSDPVAAQFSGAASNLLGEDDLAMLGAEIAEGSTGVVLVYEELNILSVVEAWEAGGGRLVTDGYLTPEDVAAALDATEND